MPTLDPSRAHSDPVRAHVTQPWLSRRRALVAALIATGLIGFSLPQALASSRLARTAAGAAAGTTLINHRVITPAGDQTPLGNLPMNAVLAPDGKTMLVANSGAHDPETLQVISTATGKPIQTIPYGAPDGVVFGLAYAPKGPNGPQAFASGGGFNTIHSFNVASDGTLTPAGDISLGSPTANIFPMGLGVTPDGMTLMAADNLTNAVSVINLGAQSDNNTVPAVAATIPVGAYPYTVVVSPDGKRAYVSNEQDGTISVINVTAVTAAVAAATAPVTVKAVVATIRVGAHPTGMVFGPGARLYVANANSDTISVIDRTANAVVRTISVLPHANAPLGSSPVSLAISRDGGALYAANAGENAVAVIDLASGRTVGRVPTAWYPSTVVVSKDGGTLFVTNAKGRGAGPNDQPNIDPNPARVVGPFASVGGYCNCAQSQYSGSMIVGTLSRITVPGAAQMGAFTQQVNTNNHVNDPALLYRSAGNPIPLPGGTGPFKHVIYINKENRTFDQVFGDEAAGNRDPYLTLFGRAVTPNLHALAERFGLLDNFYADAEVSADGHNWINGAYASDYNEKMWPQDYSQGAGRNRGYDFEGDTLVNLNPGGYLWDAAAAAHISYRDYGNFFRFYGAKYTAKNTKILPASAAASCPGPVAHAYTIAKPALPAGTVLCLPAESVNPVTTPNLVGHIDPRYRQFDGNFPEEDRVAEWKREFNSFVANNNLPALEFLRLPRDHTQGTTPGKLTPQAQVSDNDWAVGAVVDAISHSKYWADTLIVVTEDDAQNGPDHVDAHRTTSLVISAYNSYRGLTVDHTLYDTASMVRTVELVLGLRPLNQYDAQATPMWRLFTSRPDLTPYTARSKGIGTVLNHTSAFGAAASLGMNFRQEDRAPADRLNRVLWHSIKGSGSAYPVTHYSANASDN
jgi:YVTN family beta-propeller protein